MKNFVIGIALALVLTLGIVAFAESTPDATVPEAPAETATTDTTVPETPTESTDSTALQEALNAYNQARSSTYTENLEAELKGYVESGKLTQEQADLILNYYKEQQSLRNGVCPNCGYQFQNGGKGGHMKGGKGGFGGKGDRGMMGMYSQQPAQDNGSAQGMSFLPDAQTIPDFTGDDFI